MLASGSRYMEFIGHLDELIEKMERTALDPRTSQALTQDTRVRRKQLKEVRALATGEAPSLPTS